MIRFSKVVDNLEDMLSLKNIYAGLHKYCDIQVKMTIQKARQPEFIFCITFS